MKQETNGHERERAAFLAEKLLSVYSPSGNEKEIAEFLCGELRQQGLEPRIDAAGNVICEVGAGDRSVLLCPHMDTVPGFVPVRIEGGKIYGRGACDAKGPLLSMLLAFEQIGRQISNRPAGRLLLACAVGEEMQSAGIERVIADNMRADAAIFGEPCGLNRIAIGYRGHVQASFAVTSRQVHSSAPHLTNSSIEVAFSFYSAAKEQFAKNTEPSNDSISVTMTEIHAGVAHNVIPEKTSMKLDVRIPVGRRSPDVISEFKNLISEFEARLGVKIEARFEEPTDPYRAKIDSPIVRALSRSILKSGRAPAYVMKSGTGDMNTYALAFGVECVTYGPGDPKLSHTDCEFMDLDEVLACASVLANTVTEYFELQKPDQKGN